MKRDETFNATLVTRRDERGCCKACQADKGPDGGNEIVSREQTIRISSAPIVRAVNRIAVMAGLVG